jgi:hypothetical protein
MQMSQKLVVLLGLIACVSFVGLTRVAIAQEQQVKMESAQGELLAVDLEAQSFAVRTSAGNQEFKYTADTTITGARGIEGLATMSGREVSVQYTVEGEVWVAKSIEIASIEIAPQPN